MKKIIISLLCSLTLIGLVLPNVAATDFEGNEEKYMNICSASNITQSTKAVCKEFNNYLKQKNKSLTQSIADTNSQINAAKENLTKLASQIAATNDAIAEKEQEISYLETTIANLENSIKIKEKKVKDRMYSQQSSYNTSTYTDYIFGAKSFTELFARISNLTQLTAYDRELITELANEKKQVASQKELALAAKANLEAQKKQLASLQAEYEKQYAEKNSLLIQQEQAKQANENAQNQIDAALAVLIQQAAAQTTKISSVTGNSSVGQAIANKALSKQGCTYVWGSCHSMSEITNPNQSTFDCSGLVAWAHYQAGVNIGSVSTSTLRSMGKTVSSSQLQAGDIVLFSSHVGIAINATQMVHAPQTGDVVKVVNLTDSLRARVIAYKRLY